MVGLQMLPFLRSDPLWSVFPPFMLDVLEVVDSPAESQKMCCHMNRTGAESPCSKQENPDGPVLSIPTVVRGAAGTRRECFSSGQVTSRWKIAKSHGNPRG
jgi:hypothetical protein